MSYRVLQLFPQASTRITGPFQPSEDMGFLQSWFDGGSILDENSERRHINWGAIAGLALSVALSVIFWAGVVWVFARFWR
jgi:hypothetical protein